MPGLLDSLNKQQREAVTAGAGTSDRLCRAGQWQDPRADPSRRLVGARRWGSIPARSWR